MSLQGLLESGSCGWAFFGFYRSLFLFFLIGEGLGFWVLGGKVQGTLEVFLGRGFEV